jgi:hypothetical protein
MAKSRSDKNYLIYQITCAPTGQTYIGKCIIRKRAIKKSLKQRWNEHVRAAIQTPERTAGWLISQAIRQYGADAFTDHKVLEIVPKRDVSRREAELINTLKPELNTKKQRVTIKTLKQLELKYTPSNFRLVA